MAKSTKTAADISTLKNVRPARKVLMRRKICTGKDLANVLLEETWNLQIARALYDLRERAGLTHEQVAERARVPVSTVHRLEESDPRWVSLRQLVRVAHAVNGRITLERVPATNRRRTGARIVSEMKSAEGGAWSDKIIFLVILIKYH